jgi:hypothetical protein
MEAREKKPLKITKTNYKLPKMILVVPALDVESNGSALDVA